VWYLRYHEQGRRLQPRIGTDRDAARRLAADINARLEVGAASGLRFEPISIPQLRDRWLNQHEHVRRSSVATIQRYRSATEHLLQFGHDVCSIRTAADFRPEHAEQFVEYLRRKQVAPNGHGNARKRPLRDAGVRYILETCVSLFNYAQRQRHLPPYAENPFRTLEISRIPIEDARPITIFTVQQEVEFLQACDDWQLPVFATLLFTGMRPGELVHLLLPEDLDLELGWIHIRNKPRLGWQVKTRNQRDIPLSPVLVSMLLWLLGDRRTGPVFCQRRCAAGYQPPLVHMPSASLEQELLRRIADHKSEPPRKERLRIARKMWRDLGALKEDWVRTEFMRVTARMGLPKITAPKTLRHTFATMLQDANVDPLVRNELMGHAPASFGHHGAGLGMTAHYTHTRPETKRRQFEQAVGIRPALEVARRWLAARTSRPAVPSDAPAESGQ